MRPDPRVAATVLALGLPATACGDPDAAGGSGDTVTISVGGDPALSPLTGQSSITLGLPCAGDAVTPNTPPHDLDRAAQALTAAGWKKSGGHWSKDGKRLSIVLAFPGSAGNLLISAAEPATRQWSSFGVKVTRTPYTTATIGQVLSTGDWDIAWAPISVPNPDMNVPFYSGPLPPEGNNFGGVDNPEYQRLSTIARTKPDIAGCSDWTAAEAELFKRVDVVSFADAKTSYYTKGYTFVLDGNGFLPTSLRRTGDR